MWLKILSPSPGGARFVGRSRKDNHQEDDGPNTADEDHHPKKETTSMKKSKTKGMVQNVKSKALMMKQESSKALRKSRSSKEQPTTMQGRESNTEDSKISPTETVSNSGSASVSIDDNKEGLARRYWVHSSTPPSPPKNDFDLIWKEPDLVWNDVNPAVDNPEPPQKALQPTLQQSQYIPCDVSCLTDDLNSAKQEDDVLPQPDLIDLDKVKNASKAALFKAMWCGEIALEAGKSAGAAIYEKSVQASAMPCDGSPRGGGNLDRAALESASTTTQTTSGSSDSSFKSKDQDDDKVLVEKRLTQQAQQARRNRRNRLQRHHQKSSNNTSSRRLRSRKRDVSNKRELSRKKDENILMDEESTILIEEGNDCFLMTKEDMDDLVATFQSVTGDTTGICDCDMAKNIVQWFMVEPSKAKSSRGTSSREPHSGFVHQAASVLMAKHQHANLLWNKLTMAQETTKTTKSKTNTTCFVDADMKGGSSSHDTSDSSLTGRTPKIQNTTTKFVDEDMITSTPSPRFVKKKMVPIQEAGGMQPDEKKRDDIMGQGESNEVGARIRANDMVAAWEGGEFGHSEDTIETVLVSDEKAYGKNDETVQVLDSEYGDDVPEDEDIFSVLVPDDEATDATQCASPRNRGSKGFKFDIDDEEKYNWDYGHYKVNSRDCVNVLPTIHEVDIDTIVYENNGHGEDDDFLSFDLSSITPDASEDNSIGTATTGTGEALSPVRPPALRMTPPKVDLNRQLELNRRLKELEAELSALQGQYKKIDKSCQKVETRLQLPLMEDDTLMSDDWGKDEEHDGVLESEEHQEEEEEKVAVVVEEDDDKSCKKIEAHELLLPMESPLSDWAQDGGIEEYKEECCYYDDQYYNEEGVMSI